MAWWLALHSKKYRVRSLSVCVGFLCMGLKFCRNIIVNYFLEVYIIYWIHPFQDFNLKSMVHVSLWEFVWGTVT